MTRFTSCVRRLLEDAARRGEQRTRSALRRLAGLPCTFSACVLLSSAASVAQTVPDANRTIVADALRTFVAGPDLDGARVGVLVKDLADGTVLAAHDEDKGFMTASNMKLITSAAALSTLGPDFRFRTRLVAGGPLRDGVLDGNLFLVGSGDPSLGGRRAGTPPEAPFEHMVDELIERHGLRHVQGDILGDDDCQPDEIMGEGWAWGYQSAAYAAQPSGLCFAENCIGVAFEATTDGSAPRVELSPDTAYFRVVANGTVCRDGLERSTIWVERRRATNELRLGGALETGARRLERLVSVENPCAFAASVLCEVLRRKGVRVDGQALDRDELPERLERYGDETVLAEHVSPPLAELLVAMNKASQNLYAEQLIRAASRHATGLGGMRDAAAHAKLCLERLGVDTRGMRIADGSGLSRLDLCRPAQLAALLAGLWHGEHRALLLESLPIAGVDGTLRTRFRDGAAQGVVRAKTGYIQSVVALSGYVPRPAGAPPVVFSILVNNFTCPGDRTKAAVDRFVDTLVRQIRHD